jgi:acetyl esterase/lipase
MAMAEGSNRREFLSALTAAAAASIARTAPTTERKVHTYKTVDKLEIHADVIGGNADRPRPTLIWIHGGALILGNRDGSNPLFAPLLEAGFAIVSIDYRLAPETKLPAILEDVQDACGWVREKGPELFKADPGKIVVAGGSAGGYLTLTTGYRVKPRPRALVSFWGYGDVIGDWYSKPDPFYRKQPLVTKEEALKSVGTTPLSGAGPGNTRGRFYLYCRQQGTWPNEVAGLDPVKDAKAFAPFCPIQNVTADYPPTMFVHGTKDTDVPTSSPSTWTRNSPGAE